MSALKAVLIVWCVIIQLEAMNVPATQASPWMRMATAAMVKIEKKKTNHNDIFFIR